MLIDTHYLGDADCAAIRRAMDAGEACPAEVFAGDFIVDPDVRRAADITVDAATIARADAIVEAARTRLETHFAVTLGNREGAGLLRYVRGDFYRLHRDAAEDDAALGQRRVSVVLFLSGGASCEGGRLRVYDDRGAWQAVEPAAGLLVAFDSRQWHEVLPVESGVRDVIVDWFY
jgi:predicted 2-oxoglutarate/Fe(II)-dependent dioxygenase YbiX